MAYLPVLVVGLVFVLGMIGLLIDMLRRDTGHHLPQHLPTNHLDSPVVFTHYRDEIRAMQDRARDLLEEEPLRGYTALVLAVWSWFAPIIEDDMEPAGAHRLGAQDPIMEVPHRNGL